MKGDSNGVRLVVGANQGIGLALAQAQLADDSVSRLVATHRPGRMSDGLQALARLHGPRLLTTGLELTDADSLLEFGELLQTIDGGIDLAIHAAGILHEAGVDPEKTVEHCDPAVLLRLFEVNSIGPLMTARAVLRVQPRQRHFTFAALSAMVGSIADNRLGGWYGYRASKAALNQFIRTLAVESRLRHPQGAIVAIHPGTTDTGLSQPFQRNVRPGKLYSPDQTAARILGVLSRLEADASGRFLNWDGQPIPW